MKLSELNLNRIFPYILIIFGSVGLVASLVLSYDTLQITHNSHYIPSCNLNPIISCGTVINAAGDKILRLPYPFYGIAAFAVLIGSAAGILAGAKYKRWYWLAFQAFIVAGTVAAYAMLIKSVYTIKALCPFCLSVDVSMTTIFWYTTLYNLDNKIIVFKHEKYRAVHKWIRNHHFDLLIVWFLLVIGLILKHFWYYYGKHL